jgi:hypothetical protein
MLIKSKIKNILVFVNFIFIVKCEYFMLQSPYPNQNQPMIRSNDQNMMQNYQFNQYPNDQALINDNQISDNSENKLSEEEFQKILLKLLKEKIETDSLIIPNRDKKSKYKQNNDESEAEPLVNHRRKTFIDTETLAENIDSANKKQSCSTNMLIEPNEIIDTKQSVANGALLISIEMVNLKSISSNINELQDSCMDLCCNSDECDSALLSLKSGNVGFSF